MALLNIPNHQAVLLPGLASRKNLVDLSEKRVTVVVRNALKNHFKKVVVSCTVAKTHGVWYGHCQINGNNLIFTVS